MRILLLDNSHLPHVGGKEIVVHHLAKQYQSLGHVVRVAGAGNYRKYRHLDFGYPLQRFINLPFLDMDTQWDLRLRWIMRNDPFDVVHAHTTHPNAYFVARYLERTGKKLPLIVTPHGADIHKVPEVNFGKRLNPDLDRKIRWTLKQCDYATAISASVADSLIDAGMFDEQIVSIPNGVDADRFTTKDSVNARGSLDIAPDAPFFVSVGNYHPRKGHKTLVEALAHTRNPNIHVVIVGRKSAEFEAEVMAGPVAKRVVFSGMLDYPVPGLHSGPDLLSSWLQQSTGYISASMGEGTEGLSLALLEAMASGTSIIATSVSGNRDIIANEDNGLLIPPGDPKAMAHAMDTLTEDTKLRKSLAAKAQTTVVPYTWRAVAKQYIELFQSVLAHSDFNDEPVSNGANPK